jgi:hypothetical protein
MHKYAPLKIAMSMAKSKKHVRRDSGARRALAQGWDGEIWMGWVFGAVCLEHTSPRPCRGAIRTLTIVPGVAGRKNRRPFTPGYEFLTASRCKPGVYDACLWCQHLCFWNLEMRREPTELEPPVAAR